MLQTIARDKKNPLYAFPLLLIYVFFAFYIIPAGTFSYALFLLPVIILIVIYEIIAERVKFAISDILISFALLFCSLAYNYSSGKLANALSLISLLLICRYPQSIDRKKIYPFYVIAMIGIVHKLMNYVDTQTGVSVIIPEMPNYSGYVMLLFLMLSFKNRYFIGIVFSIYCAFIFYSRAYFVSLLIFGIIWLNEIKIFRAISQKFKNLLPKIVPVILIIVVLNSIVVAYSLHYIDQYSLDNASPNLVRTDLNRVTNLQDSSNYARWLSNKDAFEHLVENHTTLFFGLREKEQRQLKNTTHNTLLFLIIRRGIIFSILVLISFGLIVRRVAQPDNLKYLLPPIVTSLFLPGVLDDVYIIFLVFVLTLKPQKGKWML